MRKGDTSEQNNVFRAIDRFFQANGQWYFSAREGDIGPFRTREQAQREAVAYIRARQLTDASGRSVRGRGGERGIPGYVYRCILSMEEPVNRARELVIDLEEAD
jgi:hypothetical protein